MVTRLQFRGSIHHGGEHDGTQAGMMLEKLLNALHLAGNRKSTDMLCGILSTWNLKAHPPVTRFLHQVHTHSNKATPPNSASPYEIMGTDYIQATTELKLLGLAAGSFTSKPPE